jgi:hypothetical protein
MKKILLCAAFIAVSFTSIAQVGIGTTTPHDSAVLDISSTSKGLLIPRMTTAQRNQIAAVEGLMVYVMGDVGAGVAGSFMYYDGENWRELFRADLTIPEIISLGEGKDDLYENSGAQQVVYTILVNTDITGEITYFLKGRGDTKTELLSFDEINKNEVILKADPDYEFQEIYDFEVKAVSAAGKSSLWKPVTFSILPINEPASFSSDPSFTVDENQTSIGSVKATDPEDATLSYSISDTDTDTETGTGTELEIDDSGAITFADAPNFETDAKSYTAIVTVTDGHVPNDTTQEIIVTLGDVNEPAVFSSTASDFSFTANENQISIGSVTATDPEDATLSYSITGNELEIDDSGIITFKVEPDFETDDQLYTATVIVTDETNVTRKDITVTLANVNEPPVARDDAKTVISNDIAEPNITIINVISNDEDVDDGDVLRLTNVSYTGTGSVESNDHSISYTRAHDFNGTENITYTVSDGGELTDQGSLEITVVHTIQSNMSSRHWMDRNLGALQVATNPRDADSYGNRYQWGRGNDGHESQVSGTSSTIQQDNTSTHGDFITIESGDWLAAVDDFRWMKQHGAKGAYDPCPAKFRVPTWNEIGVELHYYNLINVLKFSLAGMRKYEDGIVEFASIRGLYWTSKADGEGARAFYIQAQSEEDNDYANFEIATWAFPRANGFTVRCIQEEN